MELSEGLTTGREPEESVGDGKVQVAFERAPFAGGVDFEKDVLAGRRADSINRAEEVRGAVVPRRAENLMEVGKRFVFRRKGRASACELPRPARRCRNRRCA